MADRDTSAGPGPHRADALVSHYQKTYELTLKFWEERNRLFLVLVSVVGAAVMLTYAEHATIMLVENALLKDVPDQEARLRIKQDIPSAFKLLIAMLVLSVFFLMVSLFQRSLTILKYYSYLARLEAEIRRELGLDSGSIAFTRESTFYARHSGLPSRLIGIIYSLVLGALLVSFFVFRLQRDWPSQRPRLGETSWTSLSALIDWLQGNFLIFVDVAIGIPTLILFAGYITAARWAGIAASGSPDADRPAT